MAFATSAFDKEVYLRVEQSLHSLPPLERAEMGLSLVKDYTQAYIAHCAAYDTARVRSQPLPDVLSTPGHASDCDSVCKRVGSLPSNGSGMWSVPSDLSINSARIRADGRCYLTIAARGSRTALYKKLGLWPTISRILASPSSKVCAATLDSTSLVRVSDGTWHIADAGIHAPGTTGEVSLATLLSRVVEDNAHILETGSAKWDGTLLRDLEVREPVLGAMDVPLLSDKVGGDETSAEPPAVVVWPAAIPSLKSRVRLYLGGYTDESVPGWRGRYIRDLDVAGSVEFISVCDVHTDVTSSHFASDGGYRWVSEAESTTDVAVLSIPAGALRDEVFILLGSLQDSCSLVVVCSPFHESRSIVDALADVHGFAVFSSLADSLETVRERVAVCANLCSYGTYPMGYCYASLVKPFFASRAVTSLKSWPTVGKLLDSPVGWYDAVVLKSAGLVTVVSGARHVTALQPGLGASEDSLYLALHSVAITGDFPLGTLGHDLRRLSTRVLCEVEGSGCGLHLGSPVGGLPASSGTLAGGSSDAVQRPSMLDWVRRGDGEFACEGGGVEVDGLCRYSVRLRSSYPVIRSTLYRFVAPGRVGVVRVPKVAGVVINGSFDDRGGYYRLSRGEEYLLETGVSFGLFFLTFEFDELSGVPSEFSPLRDVPVVSSTFGSLGDWCSFGWHENPTYLSLFLPSRHVEVTKVLGRVSAVESLFQFPETWYDLDRFVALCFSSVGGKWIVSELTASSSVLGCLGSWSRLGLDIPPFFFRGAGDSFRAQYELPSYCNSLVA